jgi:hypothetical protein
MPYPYGTDGSTGSVRSEPNRDATAALIATDAIKQVIATGTTSSIDNAMFEEYLRAVTDSVIDVNGGQTGKDLTDSGRTAVLKNALTAITNACASASHGLKVDLINGDAAIGKILVTDPFLEALPSDALTTILSGAMLGISGTNPVDAPYAANAFVIGLLTSSSNTFTYPNRAENETIGTFAASILSKVAGNTTIDTLVTNSIATRVYGSFSNFVNGRNALLTVGQTLLTTYTSANPAIETALTIGLESAVTQGVNQENQRVAFAEDLAGDKTASAVNIEKGAIYVDPYYAGQFTNGIFASLYSKSPSTLTSDAASLATGAGSIIGADGNVLTQVANTFGTFIGNGELSATNAGAYAADLIVGAQTTSVAPITGGGGKWALGPSITAASVVDLASIADVLADGVTKSFGSNVTANASAFASDIGLIAKDIANIVTTESFTNSQKTSQSGPIAEFIAGTLADYITALQLDGGSTGAGSPQTLALDAIKTDVEDAINASGASQSTKNTVDADVATAVDTSPTHANAYAGNYDGDYGAIAVQETTVTNL